MAIFNDYLLSCLPDRVQAKLRRIEADGCDAELLGRAVAHLDLSGVWSRFVRFGIRPAHVIPAEPAPTGSYSQAVRDVRERIAALDAQLQAFDAATQEAARHMTPAEPDPACIVQQALAKLAESEGRPIPDTPAWRDVLATDLSLARLALERIEESIIAAADDHGISIERRADLDPAALLQIERA